MGVCPLLLGWGELACETRLNLPNRVLGGSIGTEYGSKSFELSPRLPCDVPDRSQCATIGTNMITLLLEPNHRQTGTLFVCLLLSPNGFVVTTRK